MNKIIKWWKRKNFDLRQACIDKYSKEFVEKAKAYDEAVKAAKSKIKNDKDHVLYENDILDIFPELKESESEDERIRKAIINFLHEGNPFKNIKKETRQRWIAWLEKQGEQKPAWSEKDKEYINDLIAYFDGCSLQHVTSDIILWLKSLKDRYTWKPSDGQMKALKEACDEHWKPDGLDPLYTLWEQLKKLREE